MDLLSRKHNTDAHREIALKDLENALCANIIHARELFDYQAVHVYGTGTSPSSAIPIASSEDRSRVPEASVPQLQIIEEGFFVHSV